MPFSFLKRAMDSRVSSRAYTYQNLNNREAEQRLSLKNGVIYSKDAVQKFKDINVIQVSIGSSAWTSFQNPINLWLMLLFLLYAIFDSNYGKMVILVIELLLNFGFAAYRSYRENNRLLSGLRQYLSQSIGYIKLSHTTISTVQLSQLRIGDLVYFKRGQTVPMNVLILDSKDDEVKLAMWRSNGLTGYVTKQPVKLTRVLSHGKSKVFDNLGFYKQIMNGKLTFNAAQIEDNVFTGYIKLQKDPKGEAITFENVVPRNTQIQNSDWVIGMVLENVQAVEFKRWEKWITERAAQSQFFKEYVFKIVALYGIIWLPCLFALITSKLTTNWRFLEDIAFDSLEPGILQFFIEFMAFRIGASDSKVEKLTTFTKPCIVVYTKTGTMSFPKIYLDGIICQNHFFQVQGQGAFNKHLSLIQSPKMMKSRRVPSNLVNNPPPRLRKYETPQLGMGDMRLPDQIFLDHEVVDSEPGEQIESQDKALPNPMYSITLQPSNLAHMDLERRPSDDKIDIPFDSEVFLSHQGSNRSIHNDKAKLNNFKTIHRELQKKDVGHLESPQLQANTLPEQETLNSRQHHYNESKGELITFQNTFHHPSDRHIESQMSNRLKPLVDDVSLHSSSSDDGQNQDLVYNNLVKTYNAQQSQGLLKLENKKTSTVNYRRLSNIGDILRKGEMELHQFFIGLILCQDISSKYGYSTLDMLLQGEKSWKRGRSNSVASLNSGSNNQEVFKSMDMVRKKQLYHEHSESYQESILKFAKIHDFEFISSGLFRKRQCYEINVKGIRERYYIIHRSRFIADINQFWIVLEKHLDKVRRGQRARDVPSGKHQYLFYLKTENSDLLAQSDISEYDSQRLRNRLSYMSMHGYRFIFYFSKSINVNEIALPEQQLFQNLQFQGICCLKEQVKEESCAIFQGLKKLKVNQWLLTADSLDAARSCMFQTGLVNRESNVIYIKDATDDEQLKYFIKSNLLYIRKLMMVENFDDGDVLEKKFTTIFKKQDKTLDDQFDCQGINNLCLFIDGKLLDTIMNDDYLRTHVLFLIMISKIFVGYNFTQAQQKSLLGEFRAIKERQQIVVLTNTINDADLVRLSDVSLAMSTRPADEIHSPEHPEYILNLNQSYDSVEHALYDFRIASWQHLIDVFFQGSKRITFYTHNLIIAVVRFSMGTLLMQMMYQAYFDIDVSKFALVEQLFLLVSTLIGFYLIADIQKLQKSEKILMLLPYSNLNIAHQKGLRPWISQFVCQVLLYNIVVCILYGINIQELFYDTYGTAGGQTVPASIEVPLQWVLIQVMLTSQVTLKLCQFFSIAKMLAFATAQITLFFVYCSLKSDFNEQVHFFILQREALLQSDNLLLLVDSFAVSVFFAVVFNQLRVDLFMTKNVKQLLLYFETNMSIQRDPHNKLVSIFPRLSDYQPKQTSRNKLTFIKQLQQIFKNVSIDPFIKPMLESKLYHESFLYSAQTLTFVSSMLEKKYINLKLVEYHFKARMFNFTVLGIIFAYFFSLPPSRNTEGYSIRIVEYSLVAILLLFIIVVSQAEITRNKKYRLYNREFELNFFIPILTMVSISEKSSLSYYLYMLLTLYLSWDIFYPPFWLNTAFQVARMIIMLSVNNIGQDYVHFTLACQCMFMTALGIIIRYQGEHLARKVFQQRQLLELQQEQTTDLLKLLLPEFVHERMEDGENALDEGDVTVIFIEICKFEQIVKSKHRQIVTFLDDIFRGFDRLCLEYGIQKIETVGKVYMACIGLRSLQNQRMLARQYTNEQEQVKSGTQVAVEFSFAIMKATEGFRYDGLEREEKLKLKIGIHFGRVLSGVIGYHKPQFSLIGDTVNTASRVCSNCEECKVTISRQAYEEVRQSPFLFKEQIIKAKGKGDLRVYQVYKREINFMRLRRHSMNDMMYLLSQSTEPETISKYKKYMPYYQHLPSDPLQQSSSQNNQVSSQFSVQMPNSVSKTNILFLNSRRNTKQQSDVADPKRVKFNNANLHSNKVINFGTIRRSQHDDSANQGRFNRHGSIKRQSILSQKKRSVVSVQSKDRSNLSGPPSGSSQPHADLRERNSENSKNVVNNVHIIEHGVNSERVPSRWKTIHLDRLTKVANVEEEADDDAMVLQEIDLNPEFRNQRGAKETFYQKLQTTFEGRTTIANHKKTSGKERNYSIYTLRFTKVTESYQQEFDQYFVTNMSSLQNKFLIILIVWQITLIILEMAYSILDHDLTDEFALFFTLFGYYLLPKARFRSTKFYKLLTQAFYGVLCIEYPVVYLRYESTQRWTIMIMQTMMTLAVAINQQAFTFIESLVFVLVNILIWGIIMATQARAHEFGFMAIFSAFLLMTSYRNHEKHLHTFSNTINYNSNRQQKDALITNLLPSHILTKFYEDNKIKVELSDILHNATLLFADIAGFTAYSAAHEAEEVVNMLKHLMTEFDKLCLENTVYKVYTIGDCYVVLGVNDIEKRNPAKEAQNVMNMSLKMIDIIQKVRQKINFMQLNMRIGIHTGEFLGGVIGTDIVRYDIFGIDVLVANKMESNGEPGRVMISEDTKVILEQQFPEKYAFTYNTEVFISAANRHVKTYFAEYNDEDSI